jgi:hypothetical protein
MRLTVRIILRKGTDNPVLRVRIILFKGTETAAYGAHARPVCKAGRTLWLSVQRLGLGA